jgi:hypothetical protein
MTPSTPIGERWASPGKKRKKEKKAESETGSVHEDGDSQRITHAVKA